MPRASPAITSFNAGELTPLLDARVDLEFYRNGCKRLENFIPTVQGPARFRPGLIFADGAVLNGFRSWLSRFEFNYEQAFILEFANDRVAFLTDRARVVTTKAITGVTNSAGFCRYTCPAHGFATGMTVTATGIVGVDDANGTFVVTVNNANEFTTSAPFSGLYVSGGSVTGPYSITTPYTNADLFNPDGSFGISRVQIGDQVYLAGAGKPPQVISRTGPSNWSIAEFQPDDGPYLDMNEDEALTVYASAITGSVTLTASSALFTANHVGALIRIEPIEIDIPQWTPTTPGYTLNSFARYQQNVYRVTATSGTNNGTVPPTHNRGEEDDGTGNANRRWLYLHSGYGVARITAYTSPTQVTATVISRLPAEVVGSGKATWRWRLGAWGNHAEWPQRVTLWRDRLAFSGIRRTWLSQSNDFDSFAPDEFGVVTALSAVTVEPASTDNNAIRWIAAADALLIGTASTEFAVGEITSQDPFGPENYKAVVQSREGGRSVQPVGVGASTIYVHRSGGLREIAIRENGGYDSDDLTPRAEHLARDTIDIAYQAQPDSVIWTVSADGELSGLTYEGKQQVLGWHQHSPVVEAVQVIPSPDGTSDDVWLQVKREVNGTTYRTIEYISDGYLDDPYEAIHLDGCVSYIGTVSQTLTISGGLSVGSLVTCTAGGSAFVSGDVGRIIQYRYKDGTWKTAKAQITGYTSATQVSATVLSAFPQAVLPSFRLTVTTVSGLPEYLHGVTVGLLLDGQAYELTGAQSIALPIPAGRIHVGVPYTGKLQTMRLEAGSAEGTAQGKTKRVSKVVVRVQDTAGIRVGPTFDKLDACLFRKPSDPMDEPVPLYTGDRLVEWPSGYEVEGHICVEQALPLPATIVGLFPQVNTSDR